MNLELEQRLLAKLRQLPADRILQVEDFIDFLNDRDRQSDQDLTHSATRLAEPSFARVWDNAESSPYQKFKESGFIGCVSVEENLSTNYKQVLSEEWDKKYDHR